MMIFTVRVLFLGVGYLFITSVLALYHPLYDFSRPRWPSRRSGNVSEIITGFLNLDSLLRRDDCLKCPGMPKTFVSSTH